MKVNEGEEKRGEEGRRERENEIEIFLFYFFFPMLLLWMFFLILQRATHHTTRHAMP